MGYSRKKNSSVTKKDATMVPLSNLKVLHQWTTAPLGALLRATVDGNAESGIRGNFKASNGQAEAILIISGANHGKLVTDAYVIGPAIDLSHSHIIAVEPTPSAFSANRLQPGMIFQYGNEEGAFFIWFVALHGHGNGYISFCNKGPVAKGEHIRTLPVGDLICVADSASIQERDDKN